MSKLQKKEIAFAVVSASLLAVIIFATTAIPTWAAIRRSYSPTSAGGTPLWILGGKIGPIQQAFTCSCSDKQPPCLHGCPCGYHDTTIIPFGSASKSYFCFPANAIIFGSGLTSGAFILGYGQSDKLPTLFWSVMGG